jgi:hypothetical protein
MEQKTISVNFSRAEALVLFELLARVDQAKVLPVEHPSERTILWVLEGQLEKQLQEVLAQNYKELLEQARQEVIDTH